MRCACWCLVYLLYIGTIVLTREYVQVAVYVLIYMMLWHRGYQKVDQLMGTVHTKLKGSASDPTNLDAALASQAWDADDLVRYYTDGFFMPTSFAITEQTPGRCTLGARSHSKKLKGTWTEKCTKDGKQCQHGVQVYFLKTTLLSDFCAV